MPDTYVIGDIGACHDGELPKMLRAVEVARDCGLSALKFQWVSDPVRMATRRGRALADGYADIYRRYLAWPAEWHAHLRAACADAGIDYLCTAFLPEDVAVVAPHVRHFKVASFEADDAAMIDACAAVPGAQWIIVSLGMGQQAAAVYKPDRLMRTRKLVCTSSYPAPADALQLRRLWLSSGVVMHGLSDHSDPALTWTGALAAAAGAEIVEAHLKLDTTAEDNPDAPHAMTAEQFTAYVRHIRFAEACLGDGTRRLLDCERPMAQYRVGGA